MIERTRKEIRRILIGTVGGLILIVGIIAIPYPGPGWAIVFVALAILSTEFEWARQVLLYARKRYDAWQEWIKQQNLMVQAFFLGITSLVVVLTLWILNVYGYINSMFNLNINWLNSPLPWF